MPTHVALLRGINVGGGGKVVMADLRQMVSALGHRDVATYIQTGNVLFSTSRTDTAALTRELEAEIAARFNVRTSVILLLRAELAAVIDRNPYPAEPNPRFVHAVFLPAEPDQAASRTVRDAVAEAARLGGADDATLIGRTLYLHTPGGFGNSELARSLLVKRSSPVAAGTARNWATVTKLLALCAGPG
jgi:uncharacterized protein (DUF1697 family)